MPPGIFGAAIQNRWLDKLSSIILEIAKNKPDATTKKEVKKAFEKYLGTEVQEHLVSKDGSRKLSSKEFDKYLTDIEERCKKRIAYAEMLVDNIKNIFSK